MSEHDDGGAAFPRETTLGQRGMSLRDWFAGQALAGWLASYSGSSQHPALTEGAAAVAHNSYALADAMLAARKEPQR